MSPEEIRRFLREGTRTARIATVRRDGRPHVAPVWFLLDAETIVFTTGKTSVKGRTLTRDSRVAICVDDDSPPFTMVIIEGTAHLSEDPAELLSWATRLAARYMGEDRAAEYGRRNGAPGELLVRVTMEKVLGYDGVAE